MAGQGRMSKFWMFTWNNPYSAHAVPDDAPSKWEDVVYGVYQEEVGTNGTHHLQGYVAFSKRMLLTGVKKLNGHIHWEIRRGTHQQAKDYCKKTETRVSPPVEWGDDSGIGAGKRNDLLSLKRALDEGKSELEICDDDDLFGVWAGNHRAIERYKRLHTVRARSWPTFTTVLWGPPGTGKTKYVHAHAGVDAYWVKKPNGNSVFFDGYEGQEDVVIDEYYGWLPYDTLCRMCDRYPLMVDTKGGMTNFYPKRIWITSNRDPRDWYKRGLQALERRISGELGSVQYCGTNWNQMILKCSDDPVRFESTLVAQRYVRAHACCTEERCFVDSPVHELPDSNELMEPAIVGSQVDQPPPLSDLWCDEELENVRPPLNRTYRMDSLTMEDNIQMSRAELDSLGTYEEEECRPYDGEGAYR